MDTVTLTLAKNYTDQKIKGAGAPVSGVSSINDKTGDVKLTAEDVGAADKDYVDNQISTKTIAKNGSTDSLDINRFFTIRNNSGESGYVDMVVIGNEYDENETLILDTPIGSDLRINGVYKVISDYDVANKKYVDEAISAAINNLGLVEEEVY